jgi:tetratricopeptide (TPR) repeat protein
MSEEVFRTDRRSNRSLTSIAIVVAFLLAAYPVLRVYIPGPSRARWMLAYAANERVAGRVDNALGALEKSFQSDPEIVHDSQYWQTKLEIAFGRSPIQDEEVEKLVGHAIETMQSSKDANRRFMISKVLASTLLREKYWGLATDLLDQSYKHDPGIARDLLYWRLRTQIVFDRSPVRDEDAEQLADHAIESLKNFQDAGQRSLISMVMASTLMKKQFWDLSISVLEELLESPQKRTAEQNNLLAYCRSLSMTNLKQALVEIDLALKRDGDIPAYLDTKGWVLYQSGKYEEALSFANRAVTGFSEELQRNAPELYKLLTDKQTPANAIPFPKTDTTSGEEGTESPSPKTTPNTIQIEIAEMAKSYAVVRLHRARILEGLGQQEEAKQDFEWIKSMGIDDLSDLY